MTRDWLLAAALFLLALGHNLGAIEDTPFHPDETRWLNRAHYVRDLADPFGPTWDEGYLTRGQPPLGSYLMGAGLLAQGRDLVTNGVWNFRHGEAWNRAAGNMADPADLAAGRRTNAVVGALTVAVAYLAGARLTNRAGGVAGALLLATHPLMIMLSSQALSDALLVLLLAVVVLAGCRLGTRPGWGATILLGFALGLGGAAKLSPLLLAVPLAGLGLVWLVRVNPPGQRSPHPRPRPGGHPARPQERGELLKSPRDWGAGGAAALGRYLLAIPAIAAAVFIAVYPYLWLDPVGRTAGLFTFRVEEMARQGENWAGVAVTSRGEALRRVGDRLGQEYSGSGQIAEWLQGVDIMVGIAGLLLLAGLTLTRRGDRRYPIVLVLLAGQAGLIVLGLRSDYARYHLPLVLVMALGVSVVAGLGWGAVAPAAARHWRLIQRWPGHIAAAPAVPRLGWWIGGAGFVLALLGAGTALGDEHLPEIVALPATPVARATPLAAATPLAGTPGATPVAGVPVATPGATPVMME